jgi:hypothetical protein
MKLPTSILYYFLACIAVVAPLVAIACRRIVQPTTLSFETKHSLTDAISRLSAICEPFYSRTSAPQWMIGTVSENEVALQCRDRVMKGPLTIFDGKFVQQENQVVLKGTFHIAIGAQCFLTVILAFFIFVIAGFGKALIFDHNLQALLGIAIGVPIVAFLLFIVRLKTKDSTQDMKWIASSITAALRE